MELSRVQSLLEQLQREQMKKDQPSSATAFADLLKESSARSKDAAADAEKFLTTGEGELHQVQVKLAKADLTFRFLVEVRNKLTDAYQELNRMSI